ncbi:hypothetical protein B0H11DRAFT_2207861 [Mycena galericulata]|nr:hypothetical protein B0H11DRAFT_2207861 [Mycena galericulata]
MSWRVLRVVRGRCQLSRSWLTRAGARLVGPDTPNAWIAVRDSEEYGRERPKVKVCGRRRLYYVMSLDEAEPNSLPDVVEDRGETLSAGGGRCKGKAENGAWELLIDSLRRHWRTFFFAGMEENEGSWKSRRVASTSQSKKPTLGSRRTFTINEPMRDPKGRRNQTLTMKSPPTPPTKARAPPHITGGRL